ncbi:MAG: leucine--tRNA ligase [Thermoproteota archaeon]
MVVHGMSGEVDVRYFEEKWRKRWEESGIFDSNPDPSRPKFFITVAYPYPNSPQHIGHARTYTLTDVHARFMRMKGNNVLLPMAFHYTGTPVLSMSKRLAANDKELIEEFTGTYKVPKERLEEFKEPRNIAKYFHEEIKTGMREMGYSFDWRREFTTIDPQYSRFIEWQFSKLLQLGYIKRGSHPVGWCPSDGNPVGQHDTKGDVEPEIEEFILIKFQSEDGYFFPTATLRVETVFGVTNVWINPEAEYVKAKVDGEPWIVSKPCVEKLRLLNRRVDVESKFSGRELVNKYVVNPMTGNKVLILPASFVDPSNATGNVMSVPAHAPYDYIALEDLKKKDEILAEYGIDPNVIRSLKPISLIEVEGYGEVPAAEVVHRMGIRDQKDPKLEAATEEVYGKEYHLGRMKAWTGKYAGLSVQEAKTRVKQDMVASGKADSMYEIVNRPVYCRCGSECVVKIFSDQYFIDYGNQDWKSLVKECLGRMEILPSELRTEFEDVVDWLQEKACARRSGLGTKLPWDPTWIIESLSDSTIYMAYYIVSKYVNIYNISAEQLTNEVFDYIFLGEGDIKIVEERSKITRQLLEMMRNEFIYYYPLDSRHSGRDLIWNHLTYFIFNHVAIFPRELWPRQIVVNGSVLMEGQKMSKSLGNIIPLRDAIKQYGADALRLAVLSTAGILQDADFSREIAGSTSKWIQRFYISARELLKKELSIKEPLNYLDKWMISRLYTRVKNATDAMRTLDVKEAVNQIIYLLDQDLQWYQRRSSVSRSQSTVDAVLREVIDVRVRLLSPFAPYVCEEIWSMLGNNGFVSTAKWPEYDETKIDRRSEACEEIVRETLRDALNILKVIKIKPKKLYLYVAAEWKWRCMMGCLESIEAGLNLSDTMRRMMSDIEFKERGREASDFIKHRVEEFSRMPHERRKEVAAIGELPEMQILREAKDFLTKELDIEVFVFREDDSAKYDPAGRTKLAQPYRPAMYFE